MLIIEVQSSEVCRPSLNNKRKNEEWKKISGRTRHGTKSLFTVNLVANGSMCL
jgi:hypothetical protein